MEYILKHFDTPLITFIADNGAQMNIKIISVNSEVKILLPLDMAELSESGIETWIKHRSIPKNRAYVDTVLSSMGLSINRPMAIMKLSHGLSLNDCYWITERDFNGNFDKFNLYDNRFSRILGQIAFTGYGSSEITNMTSSPEFTTNGMLPKCWRRVSGDIVLYKGGTQGASNTGNEPYSEFYAAQIGRMLDFSIIDYGIAKWKNTLCSTCQLFTSKDVSFVPIGKIVRSGGMQAVREFYRSLGAEFEKALNEMIVFDALIYNTDRHFSNFGVLVDSHTNRIIAPAPLFDHGNSLLNFASKDALKSKENMLKYAHTLQPCVYDDFVAEAKPLLDHELRNRVRKMLNFHFERHPRYNLSKDRMHLLECVVQSRAAELLDGEC